MNPRPSVEVISPDAPAIALFDFDGTISHSDNLIPFIRTVLSRRGAAIRWVLLSPIVLFYKLRLISVATIRAIVTYVAFRGRSGARVRDLGERFAREVIPRSLRGDVLARIAWHKARGDRVVVVSASLGVYLQPWCALHGLELIASELEERQGVLTGRYLGADCCGAEKARRVRERFDLATYTVIYAYGDTREDQDLLALAHHRYMQGHRLPPSVDGV